MDLMITALDQLGPANGIVAAWDVNSFIESATEWIKTTGGNVLTAIGFIMLVVCGIFTGMKLWSNSQKAQERSWGKIVALLIVGGAFSISGLTLIEKIGKDQKDTIEEMGGGTAIVDFADFLGSSGLLTLF